MMLTMFESIFVEICNEKSWIFKKLYFFKNSMFKHSYRDGVDPLRSALKKESPYRKFHRIPSKSNLFRAKSMFYSEFARWLFYIFCPLPRGDLTPHVFLPRSRWSDPTGRGRRGTARKQQHNDTMTSCRGSRAIIAPREVRLILSGIPLSLTPEMPIFWFFRFFYRKLLFETILTSSRRHHRIRHEIPHILTYGEVRSSRVWRFSSRFS